MEIVMVPISLSTSLFLYKIKGDQIIFRSSHNPPHLRTEKFEVKDNVCYIGAYFFSADFLNKLEKV